MNTTRYMASATVMAAAIACTEPQASSQLWTMRFGPVIGDEPIVGRLVFGRTAWVMTANSGLVRIELDARQHTRVKVSPLASGETVWGLAAADPYGFWTLIGRSTLAQVSGDGQVHQRIRLGEPHSGVYSGRGELLYQVMNLSPPAPALLAGPPGDAARRPWGAMTTRDLPLPRMQAAVANLVSCGPSATGTVPCWFPDRNVVTLTDPSGASTHIALDGVAAIDPQTLVTAARPRPPIRDAFVSPAGDLWVIVSGEPGAGGNDDRRGGWVLARYSLDGRVVQRAQLPEPARMVLGVTSESAIVLAWNGMIVEVRP